MEKAQEFGSHYEGDIEFATDLKTFFNIAHMDTVYIASPNSLHFSQTKQAILAGKNVIVEKPAFVKRGGRRFTYNSIFRHGAALSSK